MIKTLLTSSNINIFIHIEIGEMYNDFEIFFQTLITL
jgi:hypothetical protein